MCTKEIYGKFGSILASTFLCQQWNIVLFGGTFLHAPVASEWLDVLTFVELLFSLPASNGV